MLGNFVSRVTKFCRSKFGEVVPEGGSYGPAEQQLIADLTTRIRAYEGLMDKIEVRKAAAELRAIWVLGNEYLQSAAPWAVYKEDPDRAATIVRLALNLIRVYAVVSEPFIPDASVTMLGALTHYINSCDVKHFQPMKANFGILPGLESPPRNKRQRKQAYADRALADLAAFLSVYPDVPSSKDSPLQL